MHEEEVFNDALSFQNTVLVDNSIEKKDYKTFIPQSKADFNRIGHEIEIKIPASDAYYHRPICRLGIPLQVWRTHSRMRC